jgi:predicted RNase H-like HicB family nuclease
MGVDKQRSNEIVFYLKGYCRKDGVATGCVSCCPSLNIFSHGKDSNDARDHLSKVVRLYIETSLKNNTLNKTVEKVMKAAEFEPGEIEQEFVWVREKEFDTAFDMAIPFSLHRPARAK